MRQDKTREMNTEEAEVQRQKPAQRRGAPAAVKSPSAEVKREEGAQLSSPAAMKAVPPLARMRLTRFGRSVPVLGSCVVRGGIDIAGSELLQAGGLRCCGARIGRRVAASQHNR